MARGFVIFGAIVAVLVLLFGDIEKAFGACIMNYCKTEPATLPTRSYITNTHRQIIGDLYDPGHGQRIQIRNKHRQITGYIETDGSIININRQRIGQINE